MRARSAWFFLPIVALAQQPEPQAPAGLDQALRARASEFFQDFIDGKFRQAMDLVADDTKDEYIASAKTPLKEYKIRGIQYSNNFTRAVVESDVKRAWTIQGQEHIVETPMSTTWKLEKDKWVWYHDAVPSTWVTPMGPSDLALLQRSADSTGIPQKITQETINEAAKKILGQGQVTGFDRPEITLSADKPSTEKVTFHNGVAGSIHVDLYPPPVPGLSVKASKPDLNFGEDTSIEISYQPPPKDSGETAPKSTAVFAVVVPFNQEHRILVNFGSSGK